MGKLKIFSNIWNEKLGLCSTWWIMGFIGNKPEDRYLRKVIAYIFSHF